MKLLSIEDIKVIQLQIVDFFVAVCEKYNLTYYLSYGTLLGAVRHGGYIPWDDDIDLLMPRKDYMNLIYIMQSEGGRYKCYSVFEKGNYYYPFIKISDTATRIDNGSFKPIENMGVNIDIFPLDFYDGNKAVKRKIKMQFYKLVLCWGSKFEKSISRLRNIFKKMLYGIYKNNNPKKYSVKIEKLSSYCDKATDLFFVGQSGEEFKSEWFGKGVKLPFENRNLVCPENYDLVLKQMYGDYMKLPPEEERVYPHGANAYLI